MAGAKLETTRYPGIYKRGNRYAYEWTDSAGKRRRGGVDTLDDARTAKAEREQEARIGSSAPANVARLTFGRYARELFGAETDRPDDRESLRGRYAGRRGAVRERTRSDYRRKLELYWLPEIAVCLEGASEPLRLTAFCH